MNRLAAKISKFPVSKFRSHLKVAEIFFKKIFDPRLTPKRRNADCVHCDRRECVCWREGERERERERVGPFMYITTVGRSR